MLYTVYLYMVINMLINIITEPEYDSTVWCRETLSGIKKRILNLRYEQKIYTEDTLSSDIKTIIIIGTSPDWVEKILSKAEKLSIYPIVVSCHPIKSKKNASFVLIDHATATEECISYLNSCGRENIALYGINKKSYADSIKEKYFHKTDIFHFSEKVSLAECFDNFFEASKKYNAVICSNYITAIQLINRLAEKGLHVPQDMYVITYGDSMLGRLFSPSLSTVTLNHELLGIQAVDLYRFLYKSESRINAAVYIPYEIIPAKSTDNFPVKKQQQLNHKKTETDNFFYTDKDIADIQSLEKMLRQCDETDKNIITYLQRNFSYGKISELLFISEGAVKYRVKKILAAGNIGSVRDMLRLFGTLNNSDQFN